MTSAEVGIPLSEIRTGLGHRIYRGDRSFGFWEAETQRLEPGDLIVEAVRRANPKPGT